MKASRVRSVKSGLGQPRGPLLFGPAGLLLVAAVSQASTLYVDVNSANPVPPYASWANAATNIQDAVDAVIVVGSVVLVTNGVYSFGGRVTAVPVIPSTNRVVVNSAITVRSVNGPTFTVIDGGGLVRCVWLADGGRLSGFTLTNGNALDGGGMWGESNNSIASNCIVAGNLASYGGGVSGGTLNNCIVTGNSAYLGGGVESAIVNNSIIATNSASEMGGGAIWSTLSGCLLTGNRAQWQGGGASGDGIALTNCTVVGNAAGQQGGGVYSTNCIVANSIVYFNSAPIYPDLAGAWIEYSCYPGPAGPQFGGSGNITNEPLFVDLSGGDLRLQWPSPCIDAGNNALVVTTTDLDGLSRIVGGTVDIGAYEYHGQEPPVILQQPPDQIAPVGATVSMLVACRGAPPLSYKWNYNNLVLGSETNSSLVLTNVQLEQSGNYFVTITNVAGAVTSRVAVLTVRLPVRRYVNPSNATPAPPYTNWAQAAVTIQQAIDASAIADEILVTNGLYATGGRAMYGTATNRVVVDRPVALRSVNGPGFTIIQGTRVGATGNGDGAVRCIYLTNGASLSGFTLTSGGTRSSGDNLQEQSGGGLWCEGTNALVYNCLLQGNSAADAGGGAFQGTLTNCKLITNVASFAGGGASGSVLNNCTLVGNIAGFQGGGTLGCTINNSIVYFNSGGNYYGDWIDLFSFSCTTPVPSTGTANSGADPLFVNLPGGDLHLQPNSPCNNAGNNAYVTTATDLDGKPRIVNGTVDIGAYEFQGSSGLTGFHTWLAQYGLPTDGSADYTDPDRDGMNNWQEWISGTNPTNAASVLRMLTPAPAGTNIALSWQSVLGIGYFLERSTNLGVPGSFTPLVTNLPGQASTTSFIDTNAAGAGQLFYRVGVGN
jgi:Ig-like domain-containing protein